MIRDTAHAFARADRAMICWTLGITEHHNAVDNVLALINLGLLCGHVGRWGSGLNPLRGQNNVQGGGDMGAIPNKLPGFQDLERDADARAAFEAAWGVPILPQYGWHLTQMFHAMERGKLRTLYVIGENPAQSEADITRARRLLSELEFLVVQDIVMTRTAEMADVVLRGRRRGARRKARSPTASGASSVSARRSTHRVRRATTPGSSPSSRVRLGHDWEHRDAEAIWDELRSLSPMHRGMRYDRLEAEGGIQWPCPDEEHPGSQFLHGRLWAEPVEGPPAPFSVVEAVPPFEALDAEYPIRLTTGRRLESYNTGAQSNLYGSPLHRGESLDLSPEDAERLELSEGEIVKVSSRRGSVEAPVRIDPGLRAGLAFMTFHFPDEVDTNQLTIDATDPKSGTAEFKAAAIRIDRLERAIACRRGSRGRRGERLMDLKLVPNAEPTDAERDALDRVLGLARSGWEGGARRSGPAGNTAGGGHEARAQRHLLLPALARRAGADRLDQPRRDQRALPAADDPARGCVRGGDVLRAARRGAASTPGRARLRGPRLPLSRVRGVDRAARGAIRRRGRAVRGRFGDVVPLALSRSVRAGAGRDADDRRGVGRRADGRAGDGEPGARPARGRRAPR